MIALSFIIVAFGTGLATATAPEPTHDQVAAADASRPVVQQVVATPAREAS